MAGDSRGAAGLFLVRLTPSHYPSHDAKEAHQTSARKTAASLGTQLPARRHVRATPRCRDLREDTTTPDSGLRGTTPATGRIAGSDGRADVDPARRCRPFLTCRFRLLSAASRNGGSHLDLQPGLPHGPRELLHTSPGVGVEGALFGAQRFHRRAANLVVPPDYFVRTSLP
jgi:hypothetical protein